MRPLLVLMGCEMFNGDRNKAINPALAVEVFHNFTLLHDDIMDKATLRRTKPTVHVKWNESTAILSGDAMFVKAIQLLMQTDEKYIQPLFTVFTATALKVCEGQQLDMDFEKRDVSIDEYLHMIKHKTAVLLGCSLQMGAMIAGASEEDCNYIYDVGCNLGMAFQLQDDLLDLYGDEERFGKKPGGDIVANKKTFLLLKARQLAGKKQLDELLQISESREENKVERMRSLFDDLYIQRETENLLDSYYGKAIELIHSLHTSAANKKPLLELAERLKIRVH